VSKTQYYRVIYGYEKGGITFSNASFRKKALKEKDHLSPNK